ncbi:MAG: bifunctional enoyl-CoA hydratase/phosphate acetyltransferase [Eubacteriales bacterium]|nr:bifunctional enoyl-CoA hydratase/phosphate acetyltransferase [Eubacteriales bacterium]
MQKFDQIEALLQGKAPGRIAVAAAHDDHVLQSVHDVYRKGYALPILIGDKEKIFAIADRLAIDVSAMTIIKELDDRRSAEIAVNLVNDHEADVLMKGILQTSDLLKAVLEKDKGLRTNRLLSHVGVYELRGYHKLLYITDGGINIAPDLKQKMDIVRNAVGVATALGVAKPKVAALAAVETVNPAMQCTLDAAALTVMSQRGQLKNCIVDGPLAMDNAIDLDAAKHKGIISPVAGDADILLCPDLEAGNILVKALIFLDKAKSCGLITGARVPIVVTSRADSSDAKYYSILLALAIRDL